MIEDLFNKFKGEESMQDVEPSLDPVSVIVQALNQQPLGTKMIFEIDFGPGLITHKVVASIDAELLLQTDGLHTQLKIEGLPEGLHRLLG